MIAVGKKTRVGSQPELLNPGLIGPDAIAAVAFDVSGTSGNVSNTMMPVLNEVTDGLGDAAGVIGKDRRFPLPIGNKDNRVAGPAQTVNIVGKRWGYEGIYDD